MGSSMKALFEECVSSNLGMLKWVTDAFDPLRHVDAISTDSRVNIAKVRSIKYLHEFDR